MGKREGGEREGLLGGQASMHADDALHTCSALSVSFRSRAGGYRCAPSKASTRCAVRLGPEASAGNWEFPAVERCASGGTLPLHHTTAESPRSEQSCRRRACDLGAVHTVTALHHQEGPLRSAAL